MPSALKKLITWLVAHLPLLGVGWLRMPQAKDHPIGAALVIVLYEALVLGGGFVLQVWNEELKKDVIKTTADRMRTAWRGFAPGFRRRYRERVIRDHGIFNVRGLGLINTFTLSLHDVFVELRIDPGNPQKFNLNPIQGKNLEGNRPIWDFLRAATARPAETRAQAIVGPPGCGKTTLLQHVALTLAANRQRRFSVRAYVPVLLFLREHIATLTQEKPPSLGMLAQQRFSNKERFGELDVPEGWFEKQLKRGRCLVLLDGLDEVANLEQRRKTSDWVDAQIATYAGCPFVISSRPQGYRDAPLQRADILEVQPFNAAQVRRFVEGWYLANEIKKSDNQLDAGVRERAGRDARDLLQRLQRMPSLSALTANPLLLTMIVMVHRSGELPRNRIELYARIHEVLLGRWRQAKGVQDDLDAAQALGVLRQLAAYMMEQERRDIRTEEVTSVIAAPLALAGSKHEEIAAFLHQLQEGSGLLLEREVGVWNFAHQTFQEYLAAAHWLEQKSVVREWKRWVDVSWWQEMLRLYAAQGDATPLVQACLEVGSVSALTLAAECLEEARELSPEVRDSVEERVLADLESTDPGRRRLAAEVQLSRRLKSLQPIDERRAIDLKFLTNAEYQLFLDERRQHGEYLQPDHWVETCFAPGKARKPIGGVRGTDAMAFCEWLTRRTGANHRYRLPRPDEAISYPAEANEIGTCSSDEQGSRVEYIPEAIKEVVGKWVGFGLKTELPYSSHDLVHLVVKADARDRARARSLGLGLDLDLDLDRANVGHLDLDRAGVRALDCAGARAFDRALDRTHALDRALDRSLAFNLALALACTLDLGLGLDLARTHALERALDRDRALDRARALEHDRAPEHDRAFDRALAVAVASIDYKDVLLIGKIIDIKSGVGRGLSSLLGGVLAVVKAGTMREMRQAQRRLLLCAVEFAYVNRRGEVAQSWWVRLRRQRNVEVGELLNLYWRLQIVLAREAGQLPVWEGIRIVREMVPA